MSGEADNGLASFRAILFDEFGFVGVGSASGCDTKVKWMCLGFPPLTAVYCICSPFSAVD